MKKELLKMFLAAGLLTLVSVLWIRCGGGGSSGSTAGGGSAVQVWELNKDVSRCGENYLGTTACDYGDLVTTNYPLEIIIDVDGDGTIETISIRFYTSLENGVWKIYYQFAVTDGGSVTTDLSDNGIINGTFHCTEDDWTYTVSGDIYTDDWGVETKIIFDGNAMTMSEVDFPGTYSDFTKTEINATENCEFSIPEPAKSEKGVTGEDKVKKFAQRILNNLKKQAMLK